MMHDARVFLGWDGPLLPRAVDWLRQRYERGNLCDMSGAVLVLPGGRAGRRLLELLTEAGGVLVPPAIITLGQLPEVLYEPVQAGTPLMAMLARMHALRSAGGQALATIVPLPPEDHDLPGWLALTSELAKLHGDLAAEGLAVGDVIERCQQQPDFNDSPRWEALAALDDAYLQTLATRNLTDQDAARLAAVNERRCRTDKDIILIGVTDLNRIVRQMLAQVAAKRPGQVTALIHAPQEEQAGFDEQGGLRPDYWCDRIIELDDDLIHVADRPRDQAQAALRIIGSAAGKQAVAPSDGDSGGAGAGVELDAGAGEARPQRTLAGEYRADEITIGLGDEESLAGTLRAFELAGLPVRAAVGRPIALSRPGLLLAGVAKFVSEDRLSDFASLLRHPDIEGHLQHEQMLDEVMASQVDAEVMEPPPSPPLKAPAAKHAGATKQKGASKHAGAAEPAAGLFAGLDADDVPPADSDEPQDESFQNATPATREALRRAAAAARAELGQTVEHWLTLLDDYISEHLAAKSVGQWLGDDEQATRLAAVYQRVLDLLPANPQMRKPLPSWSEPIAAMLQRVYAGFDLDPLDPLDADLIHALGSVAKVLREQAALDPADELTPRLSLADAITFTLARLADEMLPPNVDSSGAAIELLGWLELALDDAPALIITGFNEHHIPQSAGADVFVPNHLRQVLGLMDNRRRYARDAAALTAMLHSKSFLAIVAGRRGHDDEPLKPSRLLLTVRGPALARRILRFYPHDPAADAGAADEPLLMAGGINRFLLPAPRPPREPISRMNVTWFRTYLHCPYRFYLKHVCRLQTKDDHAVELDGMLFGNLAHEVLNRLGRCEAGQASDERVVADYLSRELEEVTAGWFGPQPGVAVRLQLAQLQERLGAFARWQARQVREGWRILREYVECDVSAPFFTSAGDVVVRGRIDRIDRHADGRHRIIDYKTGDKGTAPEAVHREKRDGKEEWIDLQLPLYHCLVARSFNIKEPVELGYVILPKKLDDIGFVKAEWTRDVIKDGIKRANEVIGAVLSGRFWPPRSDYLYADEFSAICMEEYQDRVAVVRQSEQAMEVRS